VQTNVNGTLNVLQAARDLGVERVMVTSTSEVYGTARTVPITEEHARQAQSPYSATKIAADALATSFHRSFGLPVTTVRPFNTYGPRQSARAIIPAIITQLLAGAAEIRLGSLHPTRDFVFVKDTARAFIELAKRDAAVGLDVNIATGEEIHISDLVEQLVGRLRPGAQVVSDDDRVRPALSEVERLLGSSARLEKLTGWKPATGLTQGLEETIMWFSKKENLAMYKSGLYNI
jgi:nucleoside-diphosphate-sugar epimerase